MGWPAERHIIKVLRGGKREPRFDGGVDQVKSLAGDIYLIDPEQKKSRRLDNNSSKS
jgi:hypothetical protein